MDGDVSASIKVDSFVNGESGDIKIKTAGCKGITEASNNSEDVDMTEETLEKSDKNNSEQISLKESQSPENGSENVSNGKDSKTEEGEEPVCEENGEKKSRSENERTQKSNDLESSKEETKICGSEKNEVDISERKSSEVEKDENTNAAKCESTTENTDSSKDDSKTQEKENTDTSDVKSKIEEKDRPENKEGEQKSVGEDGKEADEKEEVASPAKNLRKRKHSSNGYKDPSTSDEDIAEVIVETKKPKSASVATEKSVNVPVAALDVKSTPVVPLTYTVGGQPVSLVGTSLLQNQQVRMVLPSVSSSLTAQPLLISQPLTSQGLTINPTGVVLYPQIHSGSASAVMSSMLTTANQKAKNTKTSYGISLVGYGNSNVKTVQAMKSVPTVTTTLGNNRQISKMEKVDLRPPTDSLEMIQLVKWELKQGVYHRPKNFRLKPDSELGPMAKFLRDFGQDLVKEAVYNDLVHIQSRRSDHGKLTDKEKKDFHKLKSVHAELKEKVGPVKVSLSRRCSCGFKTESEQVMYLHKQHPHVKETDMKCACCGYETKDPSAFTSHLEEEHNMKSKFVEKPAFWSCSLCPYETNIRNKLTQHKFRCIKTFKLNLNLHPAWLPGPEANYCLEKIFYKNPVMAYMNRLSQQQDQQRSAMKPIMPKAAAQGQVRQGVQGQTVRQMIKNIPAGSMNKGPVVNTQPVRNQTLLAKLGTNIQNQPQNIYQQKTNFAPNVNLFQKGNNQLQAANLIKKTATSVGMMRQQNMPIKINNIVTNKQALDKAPASNKPNGFEVCEICGGYVKDRTALRIHFFYAHRIDMPHGVFDRVHPPLYCATCFARFWTAQGLQKHLDVHKEDSSGGVAGKCIVCLHRVPNILMHMKIVHNKAFVNFLRECKCIFCGLKFPSKTVVESHMAAVHGVVVKSGAQPLPQASQQAKKQVNANRNQKGGKNDLVKGSVCVLCNLNFGRNVDLTRHCMRVHHTCMKCGMVVADKESLMKHSCLESPSGLRKCEVCQEKGFHPAYHVKHIRDKHLRKLSIKVRRLDRQTIEKWTKHAVPQLKRIVFPSEPIELSDDDEPPAKRKKVGDKPTPKPPTSTKDDKMDVEEVVILGDDDDTEGKSEISDTKVKSDKTDNIGKCESAQDEGKSDNSKEKNETVSEISADKGSGDTEKDTSCDKPKGDET